MGVMDTTVYGKDGVDISAEEEWSKTAHALCRETYGASAFVQIRASGRDHFRLGGGYTWNLEISDMSLDVAADGLGTKPTIIAAAGRFEAAAHDLVAMIAHDMTREGGMLTLLTTVIAVDGVGTADSPARQALVRMFTELQRLALEHNFVLYKGETAQISDHLGEGFGSVSLKFLWEGVGHGVYDTKRRVRTEELRDGQVVIALREQGFRCNGISSVRKALERKFGATWQTSEEARPYVYEAATPSVLYMKVLNELLGWDTTGGKTVPIYAVCHVTGGGIPGKFAEDVLFRAGLSAELDDLWEPPAIMQHCAEWRGMAAEECYRAWNGGQGMLVVLDQSNAAHCIDAARRHGIDAKMCGEIRTSQSPELIIHSKFTKPSTLRYIPRK